MRILSRYLLTDLLRPTLMALFILTSIIWLMQSLRFMDLIINKGLSMPVFLKINLLVLPSMLQIILPLSVFAGTVYGLKRLHDDNELIPLFSSGRNKLDLIKPLLTLAAMSTIIGYLLSFWLVPYGMSTFKALQHDLRESGGTLLIEAGQFNQLDKKLLVYVREKVDPYHLKGILVHDSNDEDAPITWMAEEGYIHADNQGYPHLRLMKGTRQAVTHDKLSVLEFEEHTVDVMRQFQSKKHRAPEAEELYIQQLLTPSDNISPHKRAERLAEFHKRLLWPLSPIPFVIIAAIFLMTDRKHRTGINRFVPFAIISVIAYQILLMVSFNMASKGNVMMLYGEWVLPLIVIFIGFIYLKPKMEAENL